MAYNVNKIQNVKTIIVLNQPSMAFARAALIVPVHLPNSVLTGDVQGSLLSKVLNVLALSALTEFASLPKTAKTPLQVQ